MDTGYADAWISAERAKAGGMETRAGAAVARAGLPEPKAFTKMSEKVVSRAPG